MALFYYNMATSQWFRPTPELSDACGIRTQVGPPPFAPVILFGMVV
jgi:hypothetical protein